MADRARPASCRVTRLELNAAIRRDRSEADVDTRDAQRIRSGIDQKQLAALSAAAKEANDLIAKRTFSWTQLFNEIETTLPDDVMLMGVHPEIKDAITTLHFDVQGRSEDVIDAFWDRLEKTGRFHDVAWNNVSMTGTTACSRWSMEAIYTPGRQGCGRRPRPRPSGRPACRSLQLAAARRRRPDQAAGAGFGRQARETVTPLQRVVAEKRRLVAFLLVFAAIANVVLYAVVVFPLGRQVVNAEAEARLQHHQRLNAQRAPI